MRSAARWPASPYYHSFSSMANDVSTVLAEKLVTSAPVPMARAFFGNSGSDANDTNLKIVWYYNNVLDRPEKKKIISRIRGYHGVTVATAGLTGLDNLHAGFDVPLADDPPRAGLPTACGRPSPG